MASLPAGHVPLIQRLLARLRRPPTPIDQSTWLAVRGRSLWLQRLDREHDQRLHQLASRFLHEKTITPVAGLALDATEAPNLPEANRLEARAALAEALDVLEGGAK